MATQTLLGTGKPKVPESMRRQVQGFLTFLSLERGASDNTTAAYRKDLERLMDYLISSGVRSWKSVSRSNIKDFVPDLKQSGYSETSVARKVAAVRSFFVYLADEGVITTNPTEALTAPRLTKRTPKAITPEEVNALLEQPAQRSTPGAKRDRAMLELLYATGMRATELVFLNEDNINLDPLKPSVDCMGKGLKKRTIPIHELHERALEAIEDYLENARPLLVRDRNEPALFINRRGKRITRQGFWLVIRGYAKSAKLEGVSAATLRHSTAVHLLRGGMPLRNVQEMLGHANVTTQLYSNLTSVSIQESYRGAHPRALK